MVHYWRNLAISCGLDGLYIVQTLGGFPTSPLDIFDASLEFEPHYTFAHGMERLWSHTLVGDQQHLMFDYDYVWDGMINRSHQRNGRKVFPGAFVKWDNTPRLGVRGSVVSVRLPKSSVGIWLNKSSGQFIYTIASFYLLTLGTNGPRVPT